MPLPIRQPLSDATDNGEPSAAGLVIYSRRTTHVLEVQ